MHGEHKLDDEITVRPSRFARAQLESYAASILEVAGVPQEEALLVGQYLVDADSRGMHSHGLDLLPSYFVGLKEGHLNATSSPDTIRKRGATALTDAENGLGHVAADHGMRLAIDLARDSGISFVAVRNSNHFGMASHWTLRAVEQGMIGFATTNGPPVMAPWGGREARMCNNPFSWGIPAKHCPPIVLDMACTVVARGRIRLAAQEGRSIPEDWGLDREGNPTIDASEALHNGLPAPVGAYKGSGLAIVNELLSAALSGSLATSAVSAVNVLNPELHDSWRIGHVFMALNIDSFLPRDDFERRVDEIIHDLKATPRASGVQEILMPGEIEEAKAAEARRLGIPIDPPTIRKLVALTDTSGVPIPEGIPDNHLTRPPDPRST